MTYQMLLVDDEIVAIEGVKTDLDLDRLNISCLFTALNVRQAMGLFETETIDILLCDIEMPQGNGLELLGWVRENYPNTVTIFLTSHADFKYAKEAIQLGSLDYLLKPVIASELESAILKAQNVIDQNGESNRNRQSHRLWLKHHSLIVERFWLDLINRTIPGNSKAVYQQVDRHQIPLIVNSHVLPILISIKNWNKELQTREEKILEYALKKTAEEMMLGSTKNGIVIHLEQEHFLIIYIAEGQELGEYDHLFDVCQKYIHFCNRHFYCTLSCYVGSHVEAHQIADKVTFLKEQDRDNVAFVNQVFGEDGPIQNRDPIKLPDISIWISYLKRGMKEEVMQGVASFLDRLVQQRILDVNVLHKFNQDFFQALYSYLNQNEIQAYQLFGDEKSRQLTEKAVRSVTDMLNWISHAVGKALNHTEIVKESNSVVLIIQQFVSANIDQDLSRDILAEQVYLNSDHLSRLFKKETGYSISDYVLMERIKLAKELLLQTDIPIGAVAISVGYSNFSHFTKIFKKYAHYSPLDYRNLKTKTEKY